MTLTERLIRILRAPLPASWRRSIRLVLFRWLDLRWRVRSGVSLRVASYGDWIVYNEIFVSGEYDEALRIAIEGGRGDAGPLRVLDLGANVGFFTLRAIDRVRESGLARPIAITAVESDPYSHAQFEARVFGDNGMTRQQVRLVHGAAGERTGTATLYAIDSSHANDTLHPTAGSSSVQVPFVDLEALFADAAGIDLLKCDIEGAELLFLRAYPELLHKVRVAVFELHDHQCDTAECLRLLREYGFTHEAVLRTTPPTSIHCVWR